MIALPALSLRDPVVARSSAGLPGLPTIIAIGPSDDAAHAEQLAAACTAVRRRCHAQLVLLGIGVQRPGWPPRCSVSSRHPRSATGWVVAHAKSRADSARGKWRDNDQTKGGNMRSARRIAGRPVIWLAEKFDRSLHTVPELD
jgi:hypothetical protein